MAATMLGPWDVALFHWVNSGWSSPILDPIFVFFSVGIKGWPLRIAFLALFLYLIARSKETRAAAWLAIVAWLLSNELADGLKGLFQGMRPCAELATFRLVGYDKPLTSYGTISAHAASMSAIATIFFLRFRTPWTLVGFLIALLTGLSRIYVGVHYPSQVLLGWLSGALVAYVVEQTWTAWVKRRKQARREENA
jgi:undecaprenyl-diphosphatase